MVDVTDVLTNVSLVSAFVWFAVAAVPWMKGLRTAPERAFAAASLLVGLWALADWAFYHAPDRDAAILAARIRMSLLLFVSLGYFYFGRWLPKRAGLLDAAAIVPVAGALVAVWAFVVRDVQTAGGVWNLVRDPAWSVVFQTTVGVYGVLAIAHVGWTLRHASFASDTTRKRLAAILGVLVVGLLIWVITNVLSSLTSNSGSPAFSVLPLGLGTLLLIAVARVDRERFRNLLRKLFVTPNRPTIAILYHNSGHPVAEVRLPGAKEFDERALSDLIGAVDHVLTKGLRSEAGALKQMRHGDHFILFERGEFVTLAVISQGSPSEGLRSEMRTAVRDLESTYRDELASWESASGISQQALAALDEVLRPSGI